MSNCATGRAGPKFLILEGLLSANSLAAKQVAPARKEAGSPMAAPHGGRGV